MAIQAVQSNVLRQQTAAATAAQRSATFTDYRYNSSNQYNSKDQTVNCDGFAGNKPAQLQAWLAGNGGAAAVMDAVV